MKRTMGKPGMSLVTGMSVLMFLGMADTFRPSVVPGQGLAGDLAAGKLVYEFHCQRCHGTGGWGDGPAGRELRVPPTNFHGPILQMKSDEQLLASVEFGVVTSQMHAWRGRLTEQELQDVVAYVRALGQRGR